MTNELKISWNGNSWLVETLDCEESRFSVKCLDPDEDEYCDYTEWPSNDLLSDWCSRCSRKPVTITDGDVGDDPDYYEWIAIASNEKVVE